jgi:hypothetical protein
MSDFQQQEKDQQPFKRLCFLYMDHAYVVIRSGKNFRIVHKRVEETPSIDSI